MKRKILSAAVAATMLMGVTGLNANEYQSIMPIMADITPIMAEIDPIMGELEYGYDAVAPMPWFGSFRGTVVEIMEREDGLKQVVVENADERIAWFNITESTLNVTGNEIEVGSSITGFFENNRPMILIYPPQYTMSAVAVDLPESHTAIAARFNGEYLMSDCGMYRLNITEETNVMLQDGSVWFDSEYGTLEALQGRKMIVVYDISTRSIPAMLNPLQVVVMFETAVHLPGFGYTGYGYVDHNYGGMYAGFIPPIHILDDAERAEWIAAFGAEIGASEIVVGGEVLTAPAPFVNEAGIVMLPLRAISEALGFDVHWSSHMENIWLNNVISLRIGYDEYTFARLPVFNLGTAPVLSEEGVTFVPITFFTQVVRVNAYLMDGQVVISEIQPEGDVEYANGDSATELPEESEVQVIY